ncbi:hypothetical protein BTO30_14780 [Domibacillus antri]|uniref:Uncharacterized protein n=1 Tax=Domibacillus antri TaxID=1714264 RepID=A0A1Q8Q2C7_9BACI|nr:hypothetical protein [Domibacillus antri]OLN21465.1 hypothetical protein BTO30_14780 [Domibacillus antri]
MSKQSKGLAGFGAVANEHNTNRRNETNISTNQDTNENIDHNIHEENQSAASLNDILDSVTNKPKQVKKRQISTYIDEDVARKLDKFGKEHGKGAKSELINNFLKNVLK